MRRTLAAVLIPFILGACAGTSEQGGVVDKVLQDFGIQDRPEGYETGGDKVFSRLNAVGESELKRLNREGRTGEVKYAQEEEFRGAYFKELKVYENYYPLDARPLGRTASGRQGGYTGTVEYSYRVYQSPRTANRVEAAAAMADIPTNIEGREKYRYNFGVGGVWDGKPGEPVR